MKRTASGSGNGRKAPEGGWRPSEREPLMGKGVPVTAAPGQCLDVHGSFGDHQVGRIPLNDARRIGSGALTWDDIID